MKHNGVHHVSINVRNIKEAQRFYVDTLAMQILPRPDFGFPGLWLDCGRQEIHLIEVQDFTPQRGPHFALAVDDIEATRKKLLSAGVEISEIIDIPGSGRQAFFHDPTGNMIEVNQPNSSA